MSEQFLKVSITIQQASKQKPSKWVWVHGVSLSQHGKQPIYNFKGIILKYYFIHTFNRNFGLTLLSSSAHPLATDSWHWLWTCYPFCLDENRGYLLQLSFWCSGSGHKPSAYQTRSVFITQSFRAKYVPREVEYLLFTVPGTTFWQDRSSSTRGIWVNYRALSLKIAVWLVFFALV